MPGNADRRSSLGRPQARHSRTPAPGSKKDDAVARRRMSMRFSIKTLTALRKAEAECTRCPLYRSATQVVPGEGPAPAPLMLVGEQPGDREDLIGKPFVGPAGRILDSALEQAGIPRGDVFLTNAVKHFKHEIERCHGEKPAPRRASPRTPNELLANRRGDGRRASRATATPSTSRAACSA
jgi:hypothetical protein